MRRRRLQACAEFILWSTTAGPAAANHCDPITISMSNGPLSITCPGMSPPPQIQIVKANYGANCNTFCDCKTNNCMPCCMNGSPCCPTCLQPKGTTPTAVLRIAGKLIHFLSSVASPLSLRSSEEFSHDNDSGNSTSTPSGNDFDGLSAACDDKASCSYPGPGSVDPAGGCTKKYEYTYGCCGKDHNYGNGGGLSWGWSSIGRHCYPLRSPPPLFNIIIYLQVNSL